MGEQITPEQFESYLDDMQEMRQRAEKAEAALALVIEGSAEWQERAINAERERDEARWALMLKHGADTARAELPEDDRKFIHNELTEALEAPNQLARQAEKKGGE